MCSEKAPIFVIQKHNARTAHFDFRLEVDGKLVSWVVPKGLSKVTNEKHLAMRTPDHSLNYANFEGTIPKGEYGAGTVKIWDKGTFEPILNEGETTTQALNSKSFKFHLHGNKFKGLYAMVLIDKKDGEEKWLIFKVKDKYFSPVYISHAEKLLFPKSGYAKADIVAYYERVAPYMLPYLKDRPLTLKRYPEGIDKEGFFNKHAPDYFPSFIKRISVPMHSEIGENILMVSAHKPKDLAYLASQNTIEIHMSLSKKKKLEKPDQIIFDFDVADAADFEKVRKVAFELKKILDDYSLPSFVKTTGSKGIHVHIPIKISPTFTEVKDIAKDIAQKLNHALPDLTTLEHRKNKRGNKVYIDVLRNDYGMTVVAPYSLRAIEGAPVATPLEWSELENKSLNTQTFTMDNIFDRIMKKEDPWQGFKKASVRFSKIKKQISE